MKDGVYHLIGDNLIPVTHSIEETEDTVTFMIFGQMKTRRIISIDKACSKCTSWKKHGFKIIQECQAFQSGDSKRRGFSKLICPKQLLEEEASH